VVQSKVLSFLERVGGWGGGFVDFALVFDPYIEEGIDMYQLE